MVRLSLLFLLAIGWDAVAASKCHVVVILVDDLGYGDVGYDHPEHGGHRALYIVRWPGMIGALDRRATHADRSNKDNPAMKMESTSP